MYPALAVSLIYANGCKTTDHMRIVVKSLMFTKQELTAEGVQDKIIWTNYDSLDWNLGYFILRSEAWG